MEVYLQEVGPAEFLAKLAPSQREYLAPVASRLPLAVHWAAHLLETDVPPSLWRRTFRQHVL